MHLMTNLATHIKDLLDHSFENNNNNNQLSMGAEVDKNFQNRQEIVDRDFLHLTFPH